jgi:hypothetical protein
MWQRENIAIFEVASISCRKPKIYTFCQQPWILCAKVCDSSFVISHVGAMVLNKTQSTAKNIRQSSTKWWFAILISGFLQHNTPSGSKGTSAAENPSKLAGMSYTRTLRLRAPECLLFPSRLSDSRMLPSSASWLIFWAECSASRWTAENLTHYYGRFFAECWWCTSFVTSNVNIGSQSSWLVWHEYRNGRGA